MEKSMIKILLVEDNPLDQAAFKRLVKKENLPYDYIIVDSVTAAKEVIILHEFDIIVADYNLTDGTGLELLSDVGDKPFILVTGMGNEEVAVKALRGGVTDYLVKDVSGAYSPMLSISIENALALKQAQSEVKKYQKHLEDLVRERTEALRQSEEKYRAIFENSGTALIFVEEDTTISICNKEFEALSGYSKAELEGHIKWTQFVAKPEDLERMKEYHRMRRIYPANVPQMYEFQFADRNGNHKNIVVTVAVIPGTKQSLASLLDITERKRSEEALRESEERFRRLAENAQDMIYRMSLPDGRYEYVSPAVLSIFGYSPEECYNTPMFVKRVIHPDWHKYFEEQWVNLLKGEMPPTYEYQIIHKSGEFRWMNQRNILIRDDQGHPIAMEGIVTDITERKHAEKALKENEEKLRDIANKVPGIVYQFYAKDNGEWGLSFVNERSEEIFGINAEPFETYFNRFFDCVVNEDKERFLTSIKESVSNVSNWEFEGKLITPTTKKEKYVRGTSVPKRYKDEIVFNGILLDITERKYAEEALLAERGLFVCGPTVVFKWKAQDGWPVEYVSPNVVDQFGYTPEELISGKVPYASILHPEDLERIATEVSVYSEQGFTSFDQIYRIAHKNGSYRWIQDFTTVIKKNNDVITHYLGYILDITERKLAEEALEKRKDELERLERLTIGRELKMVELKKQIAELETKLLRKEQRDE